MTARHVLVVASQCDPMGELELLGAAASGIHSVLRDDGIGDCRPGLPDGTSLRLGQLAADSIRQDIRTAIDHARAHAATLVLVLLGHGTTPGNTTGLRFMAADAQEGNASSGVDVAALFADAADRLGVNGVIGIVDTCSAAGAVPETNRILAGDRSGRTRVALLMASAVHQNAYEFKLTRGITSLLTSGVPGARQTLDIHTVQAALTKEFAGFVKFDYDGDLFVDGPLWLGHNRQFAANSGPSGLGRTGRSELASALAVVEPPMADPFDHSPPGLARLADQLRGQVPTPALRHAASVVNSLLIASLTGSFLHSWFVDGLDTRTLRKAATASTTTSAPCPVNQDDDLTDVLERLMLCYPAGEKDCRAQAARFVVDLACQTGKPLDAPELHAWSRSINGGTQLQNAIRQASQQHAAQRLRLVASLHGSPTGDWPEAIETWLLLDREIIARGRHDCSPDRTGVETALSAAVDEAEEHADDHGLELSRVDIAIPTPLVLMWRPETVPRGEWLGVSFDIVQRWSERLDPPRHMRWVRTAAATRLKKIQAHNGPAPVDWLSEHETRDLISLQHKLVSGGYPHAVALDRIPADGAQVLEVLLAHVPIVLWPQEQSSLPFEHRDCLDVHWHRLPGELSSAYRRQWAEHTDESIAQLRAVWDDEEWLEFCKSYQRAAKTRGAST